MDSAPLTVQARALRRAADILGGKDKLRAALRVPMVRLEHWLEGKSLPPMDVFLKTVDIVSAPVVGATPPAAAVRARILAEQRSAPEPDDSIKHFLLGSFDPQDRTTILGSALDAAIEATHAQMGNVQLKTTGGGLEIVTFRGFDDPFLKFFACVTDHRGAACGAAMKSSSRVIVSDVASDPIFVGTEAARVMEGASARAVQSTPLVSSSGQFFGMLNTHFDHPHRPAEEQLELVDRIVERTVYWLEQATT